MSRSAWETVRLLLGIACGCGAGTGLGQIAGALYDGRPWQWWAVFTVVCSVAVAVVARCARYGGLRKPARR